MKNIKGFMAFSSVVIVIAITLFNSSNKDTSLLTGLEEIEALACGENGCTKDYSRVDAYDSSSGTLYISCTGCGSLKCQKPE